MTTDMDGRSELKALEAKIGRFLPPRYLHCTEAVKPTSMGSAGLKYGADGRVAWGEIWTSFCDLALAGGPPHRGKLLEPVSPESLVGQAERERAVCDEFDRAIRLTTELQCVVGHAPGWFGVRCQSVAEAGWLRAAVVAENVSARQRGIVLQLPAGPDFRAEKEIKNVVVALAKASHYWDGHLTGDQQSAFRHADFSEAATPAEVAAAPEVYGASVDLLEQRLNEATGLKTDSTNYAGWVGVACGDEETAAWLLRAVVVEGPLARREGEILYLPVSVGQNAGETEALADVFANAWRLWKIHTAN